jgi:hypothetical protein
MKIWKTLGALFSWTQRLEASSLREGTASVRPRRTRSRVWFASSSGSGMTHRAVCFVVSVVCLFQSVSPTTANDQSASFGDSAGRDVWGAVEDAPCSPSSPCVHLIPHTHLDPGWRDTFDGYHRKFSAKIHPSVVLALAEDNRRRFTFADVSFLARWMETVGEDNVPETCVYAPKEQSEESATDGIDTVPDARWRRPRATSPTSPMTKQGSEGHEVHSGKGATTAEPCPRTWRLLVVRLVAEHRLALVGGGWVSHDEAMTPIELAAAQYEEGLRTLVGLGFFGTPLGSDVASDEFSSSSKNTPRDGSFAVQKPRQNKHKVTVAWQIDPFGHASSTPVLLSHMGFEHVVLNRVPYFARDAAVRDRKREFTWMRGEDIGDEDTRRSEITSSTSSTTTIDTSTSGSIDAHLLRRHYNLPRALDLDKHGMGVVGGVGSGVGTDAVPGTVTDAAVHALIRESNAALEGITHGHAFVLVGDDFRWTDAGRTFARWEVLLRRLADELDGGETNKNKGSRKLTPNTRDTKHNLRFRWSTPTEYFESTERVRDARSRDDTRDVTETSFGNKSRRNASPKIGSSFFPYANAFPSSENAWVGSFVARRSLKNAIVDSAQQAVVASSLVALVDASMITTQGLLTDHSSSTPEIEKIEDGKTMDSASTLSKKLNRANALARSARRGAFLGLHHDAITGTCPLRVAEDYFQSSDRAVANARAAIRVACQIALRCDETGEGMEVYLSGTNHEIGDSTDTNKEAMRRQTDTNKHQRVPVLRKPGDSIAVHNARGDPVSYGEIVIKIKTGLVAVDARWDTVPLKGQRQVRVDEESNEHATAGQNDYVTLVVAVTDLPALGLITVRAVSDSTLDGISSDHLYELTPKTQSDVGALFDAKGAWVQVSETKSLTGAHTERWQKETQKDFTETKHRRRFAKLTAHSVQFPRDEHFGDGPYVSRSGTAHVALTWIGVVLGCLLGNVSAGLAIRFARQARNANESFPKKIASSFRRDPLATRVLVSVVAATRRCVRVLRRRDASCWKRAKYSKESLPETEKTARRGLWFEQNSVESFNLARDDFSSPFLFTAALTGGVVFAIAVWSPELVTDKTYRSLVDGGVGFGLTNIGVPVGGLCGVAARTRFFSLDEKKRKQSSFHVRNETRSKYKKRNRSKFNLGVASLARFLGLALSATLGALLVSTSAPWRHARALRSVSVPKCYGGAVYDECSSAFGGSGTNDPSAELVVRKRVSHESSHADSYYDTPEIAWTATAPLDGEIVVRVGWSMYEGDGDDGTKMKKPKSKTVASFVAVAIDDGVGAFLKKTPSFGSVFTEGWSLAARTQPSGKFVKVFHGDGLGSKIGGGGSHSGIVFRNAGTSIALVGGKQIQLGVHRNALSDDGHGLGGHSGNVDLSDPTPGRLSFHLVGKQSGDDDNANFRNLAHRVSRPLLAVAVPGKGKCATATWSALSQKNSSARNSWDGGDKRNTFAVLSLSVSSPPGIEPGTNPENTDGACPLWMRVQNVGPGVLTAESVRRAVRDAVAMTPERIHEGGLAYARWDRKCG